MENKLSITEIRYIRSLAGKKTDEQLAEMIDKPVALVQMQLSLMSNLPKRPWEICPVIKIPKAAKRPRAAKAPKSPKKEKIRRSTGRVKPGSQRDKKEKNTVKKREVVKVMQQVVQRQKDWKQKHDKAQFKTRQLDLSQKVAFKLNSKTTVFAEPGADIDELKKKYRIA